MLWLAVRLVAQRQDLSDIPGNKQTKVKLTKHHKKSIPIFALNCPQSIYINMNHIYLYIILILKLISVTVSLIL